jgi:hypothetical protein
VFESVMEQWFDREALEIRMKTTYILPVYSLAKFTHLCSLTGTLPHTAGV